MQKNQNKYNMDHIFYMPSLAKKPTEFVLKENGDPNSNKNNLKFPNPDKDCSDCKNLNQDIQIS